MLEVGSAAVRVFGETIETLDRIVCDRSIERGRGGEATIARGYRTE
jgi:hypothetical protein